MEILRTEFQYLKRVAQNQFHSSVILSPDTIVVRSLKTHVVLNKPVFVGACILDLSKNHMIGWWYGYAVKMWQTETSLLSLHATDTGERERKRERRRLTSLVHAEGYMHIGSC